MKNGWKEKLIEKVKKYLEGYSACHDFYHMERVYFNTQQISKNIKCDQDVLFASAYLHDIGYKESGENFDDHSRIGMNIAKEWLSEIGFPKEKIDEVLEVIRVHDNFCWEDGSDKACTIEAQIIQDSDRIEAIGTIGIARLIYFSGEKNRPIYDSKPARMENGRYANPDLIFCLGREMAKWEHLNLPISKKISKKDYQLVKQYRADLIDELAKYNQIIN